MMLSSKTKLAKQLPLKDLSITNSATLMSLIISDITNSVNIKQLCQFNSQNSRKPGLKLSLVLFFAINLICAQNINLALASELVANTANSGSMQHNSTHEGSSQSTLIHDAQNSLAFINPNIVNPQENISSILHSLINSSLDLSSITRNVTVNNLSHSVSLDLNGHNFEVNNNANLTPAEAIALKEILVDNNQTLMLNALGQASGGSFNAVLLSRNINSMELPANVTLVDNSGNLQIAHNLVNYGDIVFNGNGSIQVTNLVNESSGQISSTNILTVSASSAIYNNGGIYGGSGINIASSSIFNAGTIEAGLGSVNFSTDNNLNLTQSFNGVIEAPNGSVNFNDLTSSNSDGINLANGNYFSHEFNVNDKNGYIDGFVNNITGTININSDSAHLLTSGSNMVLGNEYINGDPTFASSGSISLAGSITAGEALSILAGGNISIPASASVSISNPGNNIVMVAGLGSANIAITGTSSSSLNGTLANGSGATGATITFGGSNAYGGGVIDLSTNNSLTSGSAIINTQGVTGSANGGSVTLVALAGTNGSGEVNLGSNYIVQTGGFSGSSTATNGNVEIITNNNSGGTGINVGEINTTGGSGGGGNIGLYTSNLIASSVVFAQNGSITSGSISPVISGTGSIESSSVIVNGNINSPQNITITDGGQLVINGSSTNLISTASNTSGSLDIQVAGITDNTASGVTYTSGNLNLTSSSALGSSSNPLKIDAQTVSLTSTGINLPNYVTNSFSGTTNTIAELFVLANQSSGSFTYSALNTAVNFNGSIIEIGNHSTVTNMTISAGNGITESSGTKIEAGNLTLNGGTGSIGSSGGSLSTITGSLTISTSSSAYVVNNLGTGASLNLNNVTVGSGQTFSLQNSSSGIVDNGIITTGSDLTGTISINNSGGTITDNTGGGIPNIQAGTVQITTGGNFIGVSSTSTLAVDTQALSVNTGSTSGSAFINDSYSGTTNMILNASTVGSNGTLYLNSDALTGITVNGIVAASGTTSTIQIIDSVANSSATIVSALASDVLTANTLSFTFTGTSLGTGSSDLQTNATAFNFDLTGTSPSIYINDTSSSTVTIPLLTGINNLTFDSLSTIDTAANITASGNIIFDANSASGSNILLGGNLTATGYIDLITTNGGTITQTSTASSIIALSLELNANPGQIGTSSSSPLETNVTNLYVNSNGSASFVNNSSSAILNLLYAEGDLSTVNGINLTTTTVTGLPTTSIGVIAGNNVSLTAASGNVVFSGGTNVTAAYLTVNTAGTGALSDASSTNVTTNLTYNAGSGDLGNSTTPFYMGSGSVIITTTGSVDISNTNTLTINASTVGGSFDVTTNGIIITNTTAGNISAGSGLSFSAANGITIAQVVSSDITNGSGNMIFTTNGGNIVVGNGSTLTNQGGTITLDNTNTTTGIISFGSNVTLSATDGGAPSGANAIIVAIGAIPTSGTNTTSPANVTVTNNNGGLTYFGANSISASSPTNTITTNTYNVLFNGNTSSSIILGGSDNFNTLSTVNLTSLDLTQSSVTSNIISLQGSGVIGGTLSVNGSGVADGGNIIINDFKVNLSNLTAEDIPANVTLELNNFTSTSPVNVNLTAASTTQQVVINGTQEFITTGGGSFGLENINSNLGSTTPILAIGSTGTITSDGSLTLNVQGNSQIDGAITAVNQVTLAATAGSNGSIAIGANVSATSTTGSVSLTTDGSGSITQTAGTISANTLDIAGGSGNIGLTSAYIQASISNLSLDITGNAFVNNTSTIALSLNTSAVNSLTLTTAGSLAINGNITGTTDLNITSAGNLDIASNLSTTSSTATITLSTTQIASTIAQATSTTPYVITGNTVSLVTNGGNIGSSTQSVYVAASSLDLTTTSTNGSAFINNTGSGTLSLDSLTVGDGITLISTGSINTTTTSVVSDGNISFTSAGSIVLDASISSTGTIGSITLATTGAGTITETGGISLNAYTVNLNTAGGEIGSVSQSIVLFDVSNVSFDTLNNSATTGNVYLNSTISTTINLNASSFGNGTATNPYSFILTSSGTINIAGIVSSGANNNFSSIDLTGTGSSQITNASSGSLESDSILLNTSGGNIGSSGNNLNVNTSSLSFSTLNNSSTSGNAYINDSNTGSLTLNAASVGSGGTADTISLTTAGSLIVNANVSSDSTGGSINITAPGGITLASGSGAILSATSGFISLNTSGNNIGASGSTKMLLVDTPSLSLNVMGGTSPPTSTSAYVNDTDNSAVTLTAATIGSTGTLALTVGNNLVIGSAVSVGADTGTGSILLSAGGSGSSSVFSYASSSDSLTSGTISLTATNGGYIGTSSSATFTVDTSNLNVATTNGNGSVYITDSIATGPVNLNSVSLATTTNGEFYLTTAASDGINVNGAVNVAGTNSIITLTDTSSSSTAGLTSVSTYQITAGTVNLNTNNNNIGSISLGKSVTTDTSNLNINLGTASTASVNISNTNTGLTTLNSISSIANLTFLTQGNLDIASINGTGNLSLSANGSVVIDGSITTASTGTIGIGTFVASSSITQTSNSYVLTAGNVTLSAESNIGSTGTNGQSINVDTGSLTVISINGSAYIASLGTPTLTLSSINSSNVNQTFDLSTLGNLVVGGSITAQTLNFTSGGNFVFGSNTSINGVTSLSISVSGSNAITQSDSAATINALNVTLNSVSGNIGSNSQSINFIGNSLTANSTNGSVYVNDESSLAINTGTSAGGVLYITAQGSLSTGNNISAGTNLILEAQSGSTSTLTAGNNLTAGASLSLSAIAGLSAGSLTAQNGGINLSTNSGPLTINASATISAKTIVLNEISTSSGSIAIGSGVTINSNDSGAAPGTNAIVFAIGSIPTTGTNTIVPTNVVVNSSNSGNAYFGSNSITASSPTNTINANGLNVIFNGSSSTTPITLGGSDIINAISQVTISSLDLTNSTVTSTLLSLQSSGAVGGTLIVTGGVATGGNLIFNASTDIMNSLTAEVIPANVSVQFNGFTASTPVDVNLTSASTTKVVTISGTENFTTSGGGSVADMTVNSSLSSTSPIFVIGSTGTLTSDGSLNLSVAGSSQISGVVTANSNLTIASTTGTNGNIAIAANLTSTNGNIDLSANGSGNITQIAGLISANTANLTSSTGNIGASGNDLSINAINLSANTSGNVFISDTNASVNLNASTGNSFNVSANVSGATLSVNGALSATSISLTSDSNLTILSALSATNVDLSTSTNGNITIANVISGSSGSDATSVTLNANGSGNIVNDVNSNNPKIQALTLTLVSGTGNIGGIVGTSTTNIMADASALSANTSGNVYITDSNASGVSMNASSGNSFNFLVSSASSTLSLNGALNANSVSLSSTSNLTINGVLEASNIDLSSTSNGNITLANVLSGVSGANATSVTISANGSGSIVNAINSNNPQILATTLTLTSGTGNIGSLAGATSTNIKTNASIVSANTSGTGSNGNVYISDNNANSVNLNASTGNSFNLNVTGASSNLTLAQTLTATTVNLATAGGSLTTNATLAASNLNLTTAGSGALTINSQIGLSTSTDNLNAGGYLTTGTNGVIMANTLNLTSTTGEIGFGVGGLSPLTTQAKSITFDAPYSVGISNTSTNLDFGTSSTQGNFYIYQTGNITASGTITAPVLGLYSFSGSTGIGSSTSLIQVNSGDIGLQSYATGASVYVNDLNTANTYLQASQASLQAGTTGLGGVFKLNTAGALSIYAQIDHGGVVTPGNVSAQIIAIQAFDANNGYGIYNDANITSNDFIFLTASQAAYIAQSPTSALMTAPNIALVTGGGAIGAGSQLILNSGLVAASTQSANGFVNIYDEATNSGIFGGQSGTSFTFNTNGNLDVFGSIGTGAGTTATGGNINLTANGIFNVGTTSAINLTTNNGSITLQNNNTTAGAINIASNDLIFAKSPSTSSGYVVFNIGTYNQANTTNPNPSNITIQSSGGAQVYFGNNGITASSPGNVLTAQGQSITFNTGSLAASAITLGGNDKIIADPPIATLSSLSINGNIQNSLIGSNLSTVTNYNEAISPNIGNVLDNNQATTLIDSNNIIKKNNSDFGSFGENEGNRDIVENTSLILPISFCQEFPCFKAMVDPEATFIDSSKNNAKFSYGCTLISASHNMEISLGANNNLLKLNLKRGALILAVTNGKIISLYNLHDRCANSVVIKGDGVKSISLNPGRHVSLVRINRAIDFAYVNQIRTIAYRDIKAQFGDGTAIYTSDFSIPSAINSIKQLKAMFKSNDNKVRILANQILKTIVVVTQSTSYKGIYEQVAKPKLTAMR